MDRTARARRGFNPTERMATEFARRWNVEVARDALVKVRATRAQSALRRDDRLTNLARAFAVTGDAVCGRPVVLVDDLVTTGATAVACAHALLGAGACTVRVVCAGYRP